MCVAFYYSSGYFVFFFKQKTAYEMRISDWSSDVCSSDLSGGSANASADGLMLCLVSSIISYRLFDSACLVSVSFSASAASSRSMSAFTDDRNRQIGRASCRERVCQYV